jgi:hypothetical protein
MAVSVEVSVLIAMAGNPGLSFSKRFKSSAEKC